MARNIRWDKSVLENAIALLDALLDLAKQQLEDVKAPLVVRWENQRLRVTGYTTKQANGKRSRTVEVGTKKQDLLTQFKAAGKILKCPRSKELEEIQTVLDFLRQLELCPEEKPGNNKGYWKFSLTLKHQTATREENLEVVRQKWREHTKNNSSKNSPLPESSNTSVNWHNICGEMLTKYKRLTTNELLFADEDMKFQFDEIRVPLALVERTKTEKRPENIPPEFGSQLLQPAEYQEKQKYEHNDFLEQVVKQGNGKTQGKRIALIGEPGAGKTTLLQAIAFWILEKNLGLPIWISLADLQLQDGSLKNFGEYLRESWLGSAIANLNPAIKTEFIDKITLGQVWLLLDGVDEIVTSSSSPLQAISSQLVGWVAKSRVLLTCRLNVWEGNLNALEDFETYRLLDFNYPSQVKQFIENWFQPRNSNTTNNTAEELWQELNKPERQRIQDLVRSPLRVALLCATWQSSIKGLPETKAGLYSLFVKYFYNWKSNRFPTKERQRRELNTALGNLARIAIDGETSRFRLKYDLVSSVLGDADEEDSLFCFALKLGWLNQVGIADESGIQEEVYAFYHPTFQEYFAAQAIDDWDFFLPREHKDRPIEDKDNPGEYRRYRIFESQWKQVILLWFGRDNNQISNTQKDNFIKALTYFNDGCDDNNLYGIKSYLLAGSSIAEYKSCLQADEIIRKIIRWGIGYFDSEQQEWYCSFEGIVEVAKITLIETDTQRKNDTLVRLLQEPKNECVFWDVLKSLGKNAVKYPEVFTELLHLIKKDSKGLTIDNETTFIKIYFRDQKAIIALTDLIKISQDENTQITAAEYAGLIDPGNNQAVDFIIVRIQNDIDKEKLKFAIYILGKIGNTNQKALDILLYLINSSQDKEIHRAVIMSLGQIACTNPKAVTVLQNLISSFLDKNILSFGKHILSELNRGRKSFFSSSNPRKLTLSRIPAIFSQLYNLQEASNDAQKSKCLETIIGKILSSNKIEVVDALLELIRNNDFTSSIRWEAIDALAEIAQGHQSAIDILVELINNSQDLNVRWKAVKALGEINPSNEIIIDTLVDLIGKRHKILFSGFLLIYIGKFCYGSLEAIDALLNLMKNSNETYDTNASKSLQRVLTNPYMPKVVTGLKQLLEETTKNDKRDKDCIAVIWHCAQNMNYPDFYKAWHETGNRRNPQAG